MTFLVAAVVIAAMMIAVWGISVAVKDASVIDLLWGPGFVVVAWVTFLTTEGDNTRATLLTILASIWGLRLGAHLAVRNIGKGEDPRYAAMRRRRGENFWIMSLVTIYALQGAIMWVVSLPLQIGISQTDSGSAVLMVIGTIVFIVGFAFEAVGDWQLTRFKADAANASAVMDKGLWRYTRHPNYFGDAVVWWGIGLVAASTAVGVVGLVGPALITFFLVRISGVPMLERSLLKSRPGYREYVHRTSSFIPRPPKP